MADRRLQVFYTVAKQLSFTKAAELLYMTQPAVTFQVKQLEEHLGVQLLERTNKSVMFTGVGEVLTARARQILSQVDEMKEIARQLGLSPKTVDNHLQSIYAKLGVKTRAGAALVAVERGFLLQSTN